MAANATANKAAGKASAEKAPVVKAAKKYAALDLNKLTWYKDPTTVEAEWASVVITVGQYLVSTGAWDGTTISALSGTSFDAGRMPTTQAQRTIMKMASGSKKLQLTKHLMRGGPVPEVWCTLRDGLLSALDGLQRTDANCRAGNAHVALAAAGGDVEKLNPDVKALFKALQDAGHVWLNLDAHLDTPFVVRILRKLREREETEKFGHLNLDGEAVSKKHLTEALHEDLRATIQGWEFKTVTEKELITRKAEQPKDENGKAVPVQRPKPDEIKPVDVEFPLSEMTISLYALVSGSLITTRSMMLADTAHGDIQRAMDKFAKLKVCADTVPAKNLAGEDVEMSMLQYLYTWFWRTALPALVAKYGKVDNTAPKAIKGASGAPSEAFYVPFLAALGSYCRDGASAQDVLNRLDEFMEMLSREDVDPLKLFRGDGHWQGIFDAKHKSLAGSQGIKARKLWFYGMTRFYKNGEPMDWEEARTDAGNRA